MKLSVLLGGSSLHFIATFWSFIWWIFDCVKFSSRIFLIAEFAWRPQSRRSTRELQQVPCVSVHVWKSAQVNAQWTQTAWIICGRTSLRVCVCVCSVVSVSHRSVIVYTKPHPFTPPPDTFQLYGIIIDSAPLKFNKYHLFLPLFICNNCFLILCLLFFTSVYLLIDFTFYFKSKFAFFILCFDLFKRSGSTSIWLVCLSKPRPVYRLTMQLNDFRTPASHVGGANLL